MSGQGWSYHTHSTKHTQSQHGSNHVSTSTSVNQWHSETNSRGHLVIAKKLEPTKSAERKVEKKISHILSDFKTYAKRDDVERTTASIMKVIKKFNRGEYNESETSSAPQTTSASKATSNSTSTPKSTSMSTSTAQKSIETKSATQIQIDLKKEVADRARKHEKVPRELMNLLNSDGFVEKPAIESKRTPRKVTRFTEEQFYDQLMRTSRRRKSHEPIQHRSIEKKAVRKNSYVSPPKSSSSGVQYQKTVTQTKRTIVSTVQQMTSQPAVDNASSGGRLPSQPSPVSVPRTAGNFSHNRVKITHYPMVEVKLEPID